MIQQLRRLGGDLHKLVLGVSLARYCVALRIANLLTPNNKSELGLQTSLRNSTFCIGTPGNFAFQYLQRLISWIANITLFFLFWAFCSGATQFGWQTLDLQTEPSCRNRQFASDLYFQYVWPSFRALWEYLAIAFLDCLRSVRQSISTALRFPQFFQSKVRVFVGLIVIFSSFDRAPHQKHQVTVRAQLPLITIGRKPGPKSRCWFLFALLCCIGPPFFVPMDRCETGTGRSEGYTSAMGGVETSRWYVSSSSQVDVKLHGMQPPMCGSTKPELTSCRASPVVKRSLHRAQKRAHIQGFAWYRGRCLTPNDFIKMGMQPVTQPSPPIKPQDIEKCNTHQGPRRRMTCLSWNCGGLSNHRMDELKHWLTIQKIQIAVISETRWSFDAEWSDSGWHHIHSTDVHCKGSGVLVLLSTKLCTVQDIRWNAIIPGRLVHVRILMPTRNVDVIGCYQHVHTGQKRCLQNREVLWNALEQTLRQLPARNTVAMLGDMNCSLPESPGICGTSFFRWQGKPKQGPCHADGKRFLSILRQFSLVALNTWDASQSPTFAQNGAASRIDFVCTRMQHADGQAKAVQCLWNAPFMPITQYGHAPLLCHLARYWIPPPSQPMHGLTPHQRQRGRMAKLSNSSDWQEFVTHSASAVWRCFDDVLRNQCLELQDVHDTAMKTFSDCFPAMSRPKPPEPWTQNVHTLNKWQHRQLLQAASDRSVKGLFDAWFHAAKFQKLTRCHRRHAKQLRKHRFEETLRQANFAAASHDTHQLFDLINRFAPRTHRRRVQLRSECGALMTPSEERSMLVAYVRETWRGPLLTPLTCDEAPGVPFTVQDLAAALRKIPSQKATAAPCAPGIVWNSIAETIAPMLHATLTNWWSRNPPWIPKSWRTGWLQLIPKPSKPPTRPQNLRPLALQCPLGKAVLGLLIKIAALQADDAFRPWPIWAFMRSRSTHDPLLKVAIHCRETRALIKNQRSTPQTRASSVVRWPICGGIQVFIDLEKAFDCINRVKLFHKLHLLGISESITQLLQCWHVETPYIVTHGGESVAVDVSKGLRQGCKGAPFLWNCMMVLMLLKMQAYLPLAWIQDHLSIYADDCHVGGTFRNIQEFEFLLHAIGILFSLLHEFDMTLNPTKSIAILAMHGPKSRKVRTAWVQRDHRGEMLKIPITGKPHVLIPIKEKATYLGCIMSYQHFEDDTTWHRVKFANVGFMRLRRWLCNRNHFSLQHRLSLWRACILPIMTYGVFAVGTTVKGLQHMLTQLGIMLRRIVGDHAHHTRHTNFQVFETFDLPRPTDLLTAAVETLQRSIAQRDLSLGPADIALKLDWSHLDTVIGTITQAQAAQSLQRAETAFSGAGADPPKCFFCNICSFCSNSVSAFRRHCTTAHGLSMFRIFAQPMHSYTTDGLPTCKYCAHSFTTWRSFRTHIERGCQALILGPASCTGIPLTLPMTALNPPRVDAALRGAQMLTEADLALLKSKPWSNRLFQIIADDTLDALEREHEACGYLSSYCCICGQHLNRTQDVHLHYRTEHAAYWDFVPQKSRMLTNIHSSESPCPHCGGYFKQHQCPVWTQVAVLILHGGGLHAVESGPPEAVVRCDICLQSFADAAQLASHLQHDHKLAGITFNAARDSLNAEAKCAHCWTEYSTMESLRSHISQGRCSSFDAFAATEVVPLTQAWLDICLHGRMYDQLRAPMDRLHLTLKCVQCKQAYQRAGDLANHLMTNHSNLWRRAQHLTLMMVDLVFSRQGCMCNPQIHQLRQNHVCLPLRQIAMMYYRLDQVPFMPIQLHDQVLQQLLHCSIPRELRFCITKLMADRAFQDLWTNPEVTQILRKVCLQCGTEHHAGVLCRHIQEAHLCGHRFVEFYFDTLVPAIAKTLQNDFQCDLCCQVYNLPPDHDSPASLDSRAVLVQIHLHGNCPVILQSCILLATALHGGRLGYDWHGSELPGTNQGDFSVPTTPAGPESETPAKPTGTQTKTHRRQDQSKSSRSRSHRSRATEVAAVPPGLGAAGAPTRAQSELAAKHRLFHSLLPAGQRGLPTGIASGDTEVASATPSRPGDHPDDVAPTPVPTPPPGLAEQGHQSLPEQTGRSSLPPVPREEPDLGGHELAVPPMGTVQEAAGDRQEEISHHAEDVGTSDGVGRGVPGPGTSGALPGPCDKLPTIDGAMEAATEPPLQQALRPVGGLDALSSVDAGWHHPEDPCTPAKRPCQDGSEPPPQRAREGEKPEQIQREVQGAGLTNLDERRQLCLNLSRLVLGNDSNWCFANVTMYGLLWTLLCHLDQDFISWGLHSESLHQFILENALHVVMLNTTPWFVQLLECWGRPQTQQDCGEFIHATLAWLDSPAIDMSWERRCEIDGAVRRHDTGGTHMPLLLQFTHDLAMSDTCTFAQLIRVWHQADGMQAALQRAAPILCIQVDRMFTAPSGLVEKSSCALNLDSELRFPVFEDDSLHSAHIQYSLVAAASHLGLDEAGHYQALLRMTPALTDTTMPVQWLVTQDNVQPFACWNIPPILSQNLTVAWFVRTDCHHLPLILQHHAAVIDQHGQPDAMTKIFELLTKGDET